MKNNTVTLNGRNKSKRFTLKTSSDIIQTHCVRYLNIVIELLLVDFSIIGTLIFSAARCALRHQTMCTYRVHRSEKYVL